MHIFNRGSQYILYNENNLEFYTVDNQLGEKLSEIGDDKIAEMLNARDVDTVKIENYSGEICERLVLVISQDCNLGCKYCYAQQGSYGENHVGLMTLETLKNSVKFILSEFRKGVNKIQFFGGEPLLNLDLMEQGCEWITGYFKELGLNQPIFTIVTNGTIMNHRVIDMFNKYSFIVTISLDGNKEVNDINRIYKNSNKSVFEEVKKNIKQISEKRNFPLCIEMTVDKQNIEQFIENRNNLIDIEEIHMLKPDMLHIVPAIWNDTCNKNNDTYVDNLKKYFDKVTKYSIDTLETENPLSIMKVVDMAAKLINKNKKTHFCLAGIKDFSISVKGDIYPCFVFIGKEDFNMGNVNCNNKNSKFSNIQEVLLDNTFHNCKKCNKCWAKGMCSNCIGNAYLVNGHINMPITEFCEIQKTQLERTMIECDKLVSRGRKNA